MLADIKKWMYNKGLGGDHILAVFIFFPGVLSVFLAAIAEKFDAEQHCSYFFIPVWLTILVAIILPTVNALVRFCVQYVTQGDHHCSFLHRSFVEDETVNCYSPNKQFWINMSLAMGTTLLVGYTITSWLLFPVATVATLVYVGIPVAAGFTLLKLARTVYGLNKKLTTHINNKTIHKGEE